MIAITVPFPVSAYQDSPQAQRRYGSVLCPAGREGGQDRVRADILCRAGPPELCERKGIPGSSESVI